MTTLKLVHVAYATGAIYAFGFSILTVLALWPSRRRDALDFAKTLATATAIIAGLTVVFVIGPKALLAVFPLIVARVSYEAAVIRLTSKSAALVTALFSGGGAFVTMLSPLLGTAILGIWLIGVARFLMIPGPRDSQAMVMLDLLVFPVLPAILLASGTVMTEVAALLLAAYLMVEIFDSFALFFGALWGRTKAFPILSPRKTIEGLAGGAFSLAGLSLLTAAILGQPLISAAFLALMVGVLAIAGDLAASRHKRIAGVKDYPQVLPRQGGLLDTLDSWIAAGAGIVSLHILSTLF